MIHRVNSDEKRIQKAYRTILLKNHPDKGGSPYLAAKVNQAKDMLLEGSTTGSHLHVCLKHSIVQSLTLQYVQQSYPLRSYNFPPPSASTACPPSARTIAHKTRSLLRLSTAPLRFLRRSKWLKVAPRSPGCTSDMKSRGNPGTKEYIECESIEGRRNGGIAKSHLDSMVINPVFQKARKEAYLELDKKIRRFASAKISLAADSTLSVGSAGLAGSVGSAGSAGAAGAAGTAGAADPVDSLAPAGVSLRGSLPLLAWLWVSPVSPVSPVCLCSLAGSFFGSSGFPAGLAVLRTRLGFAGMVLFRGVLHTTHRETLGGLIFVHAGHAQPPTMVLGIAELVVLGIAELVVLGIAELVVLGIAELVISTWAALVGFLENIGTGQCPQFLGKAGRFLQVKPAIGVYALTAP